jgi:hypothetical protein
VLRRSGCSAVGKPGKRWALPSALAQLAKALAAADELAADASAVAVVPLVVAPPQSVTAMTIALTRKDARTDPDPWFPSLTYFALKNSGDG